MSDVVAPDGSPVAIYRALPRPVEADTIHAAIPPAARILDLGAGTGRFARALAAAGHHVTAVDQEAAMLEGLDGVAGIRPVVADIIGLTLGERFDVVLLTSHLVDADPLGTAAVDAARRHVVEDGCVIGECYPPGFDWPARVGRRSMLGPVGITVVTAAVDGDRLTAAVRYDLDGRTWDQPFTTQLLGESGLRSRLTSGGLAFERWLDRDRGWWLARPSSPRERQGARSTSTTTADHGQ